MALSPLNRPKPPAYTDLEVEAALCVWEELLERMGVEDSPFDVMRKNAGTPHMRQQAMRLGQFVLTVHDNVMDAKPSLLEAIAYDFEFVPLVLDQCPLDMRNSYIGTPPLGEAVDAVMKRLDADQFEWWIKDVNNLSKANYSIAMTGDAGVDREDLERAYRSGTPSRDYVEAFARKHDLQATSSPYGLTRRMTGEGPQP